MQGYIRRGWQVFEEASKRGDIKVEAEPAADDETQEADGDGAGNPMVFGIPGQQAALSQNPSMAKAKARAQKRINFKDLRARAKCTLLFVLEPLCSKCLKMIIAMTVEVLHLLALEHANLTRYLRSEDRVRAWQAVPRAQ